MLFSGLSGCGGGSASGGGGGGGVTPPSGLSYSQPVINAAVEFPVTPDTPAVTGSVTSYSISPALPGGMTINASTGVIAGTPTAASAQANYTVTASNAGGGTTAVLQIGVSLTAPDKFAYAQTTINATTGVAIQADIPSIEGVATAYSVAPSLPAGLSLNSTTGAISGTPTAPAAPATYVVTASNSAGSATASVQITVSPAAPANLVYPQMAISATVGTAIAADVPTVNGIVTGYAVSPALPAGISLNATTGIISGTPTAASAQTAYVVTASNSAGSTTATVQITVTAGVSAPSNLVYPQATINGVVGTAIAADRPTVNGQVTDYSISPALPAGLVLDAASGTISGTPTAASAQATYTVTAENSGGSTTAQVGIVVAAGPEILYQGGHQSAIKTLHSNNDRLLSSDSDGHWILWDFASEAMLAQGNLALKTDLEGQIFAIYTGNLEIRSTQDGSLLFTAPGAQAFSLPADGSYVCTGSTSQLTIWSPSGSAEVIRSGDYSNASIFAAAGQVEVVNGAAGSNVVETIDVATGSSTVSPTFQGKFQFWFTDGSKFATQLSNVYWVYSSGGVQQTMATTPAGITNWSGGSGDWLWGVNSTRSVEVFSAGASAPTQTFPFSNGGAFVQQGSSIVVFAYGYAQLSVIDLSGSNPAESDFQLPSTEVFLTAYTKNASGQWAVGNRHGVVMDATDQMSPKYFDYGQVLGLAAGGNTAAVATASGRILLYDLTTAGLTGTIDFLASRMEMSLDGGILAAGADALDSQFPLDATLNIYSLPSLSVIHSFPYTFQDNGPPVLVDFSLSGSGSTLGQTTGMVPPWGVVTYSRQVTGINGTPLIWSDDVEGPTLLSPDGTLVAAPDEASLTTWIYKNGVPVVNVNGVGLGWADNNDLLVATYAYLPGGTFYAGSAIYDATGAVVRTLPALPEIVPIDYGFSPNPQFPSANSVYDVESNTIYSLTTGLAIWKGQQLPFPMAAFAGSSFVYYANEEVQVVTVPTN